VARLESRWVSIALRPNRQVPLYRLRPRPTTSKHEPAFEVLRVDDLDAKRSRPVGAIAPIVRHPAVCFVQRIVDLF
jgi:hypothetical protein